MPTQRADLQKQFTLDGDACDISELHEVNDFPAEMTKIIDSLEVGDELVLGGGAGADFVLRREA